MVHRMFCQRTIQNKNVDIQTTTEKNLVCFKKFVKRKTLFVPKNVQLLKLNCELGVLKISTCGKKNAQRTGALYSCILTKMLRLHSINRLLLAVKCSSMLTFGNSILLGSSLSRFMNYTRKVRFSYCTTIHGQFFDKSSVTTVCVLKCYKLAHVCAVFCNMLLQARKFISS